MPQDVILPVPSKRPFRLSRTSFGSFPSQYLCPVCNPIPCVPTDFHQVDPSLIVEMFPFNNIFFGEMYANIDTFFVSLRDIYGDKWMKWYLLGKVRMPKVDFRIFLPTTDSTPPSIDSQYWKLLDMLGYPTSSSNQVDFEEGINFINPTKFFMYWKIVLDYYLDPSIDTDLIDNLRNILLSLSWEALVGESGYNDSPDQLDSLQSSLDSTAASVCRSLFTVYSSQSSIPVNLFQRRLKRDYFTSVLPNLQFGEPMRIPVEGPYIDSNTGTRQNIQGAGTTSTLGQGQIAAGAAGSGVGIPTTNKAYVIGGTIRDLQRLEDVQRFIERLNFAGGDGAHLSDLYDALYGDRPDNMSLGRAQWISSFRKPVVLNEVVQTSNGENDSDPLGTKVADGIIAARGDRYTIFTKDYGFLFNLFSLMPKVAYQFVPRDTISYSIEEFFLPDLQLIGEQEMTNAELSEWMPANQNLLSDLFGYEPRYQELREAPDEIHGAFKTTAAQSMVFGRQFVYDGTNALNSDFLQYPNAMFNRIFSYINPQADTCFVKFNLDIMSERPVVENPNRLL